MSSTPPLPYSRVVLAALVASAVGLTSILLPIGEMDDFLKSYVLVAIVSVGLWIALAKRLRGRPVWIGAVTGLLSPILACLALAPVGIGILWTFFLAQTWYFTIPIALATGLAMHRIVNVPTETRMLVSRRGT